MDKQIIKKIVLVVFIMGIFGILGFELSKAFNKDGDSIPTAYDITGEAVFPDLPVPSGNLSSSQTVPLPDIHNNGHGWTCTGLAYDSANNVFLVGDIGKALPSSSGFASQIVKMSPDFETVKGTITLYDAFPNMQDVQGITIDSDGSIWFCSPSENKIRHITAEGVSIGDISITQPTGIAYEHSTDSFWVLNYSNKILSVDKNGSIKASYDFAYSETLDQCFLDESRGYLYITAGANYNSRNNIYVFNTSTHEQSIVCTVDSYSIEGLWIGTDKMIIVNDGYYHSALVAVNQANIYDLQE